MKTLFRFSLAVSAALFTLAAGCGDDDKKPGDLVVNWTHGATPTCATRGVVRLQARALRGVNVAGFVDVDCPADDRKGAMTIVDLSPQSYRVEVEGYDANDKGTHLGVLDNIRVPDGGVAETEAIQIGRKPIELTVDWTVPGGKCAGSPIKQVRIDIIPNGSNDNEAEASTTVACDSTFMAVDDAGNEIEVPGIRFDAIKPNADLYILASGLNSAGDGIAEGRLEKLVLEAGDVLDEVLELTLCTGVDSACD